MGSNLTLETEVQRRSLNKTSLPEALSIDKKKKVSKRTFKKVLKQKCGVGGWDPT